MTKVSKDRLRAEAWEAERSCRGRNATRRVPEGTKASQALKWRRSLGEDWLGHRLNREAGKAV